MSRTLKRSGNMGRECSAFPEERGKNAGAFATRGRECSAFPEERLKQ